MAFEPLAEEYQRLDDIPSEKIRNAAHTLAEAFVWGNTERGAEYWSVIYGELLALAKGVGWKMSVEEAVYIVTECIRDNGHDMKSQKVRRACELLEQEMKGKLGVY